MGDKSFIFVYGTLMKGFVNNKLYLSGPEVEFIDEATTLDRYSMHARGFPILSTSEGISTIQGELYSVNEDVIKFMDSMEADPKWGMKVNREKITIKLQSTEKEVDAFWYINEEYDFTK